MVCIISCDTFSKLAILTKIRHKTELDMNKTQHINWPSPASQPLLLSRIYDYWKAIVCSFTVREQTYVSLM